MDRRQFITAGLAAASSLALARGTSGRGKPRDIVVIGAGLAGLVAAYELNKAGHKVTVVEAQERVGGRVLTLREFAGGQYADAGAARIPQDHDLTRRYVKEFGLELIPFYPSTGKFTRIRNGRAHALNWTGFADATSGVIGLESADGWQKIKGGNDLLPTAFAERLKDHIRYRSPVSKVERAAAGVTVWFLENGKAQSIKGDIAICAVPLTMLRKIQFSPALSDSKMNVITRNTYVSASRVFVQTRERPWQKQGLNGFGLGERQDEIWDVSFGEGGTHGILESYSRGVYSRELTRQAPEQRIELALRSFEKLFGDVRSQKIAAFSKCWSDDPWVAGAWAHLGPVEIAALAKPEGPIYFAGEHMSFTPSWMQGAIQSGLYVVDRISKLPASFKRA